MLESIRVRMLMSGLQGSRLQWRREAKIKKMGSKAIPVLLQLLRPEHTREAANGVLCSIVRDNPYSPDDDTIAAIVRLAVPCPAMARALGSVGHWTGYKRGDNKAIPHVLRALLRGASGERRRYLLESVTEMSDEAAPYVLKAAKSKKPAVRAAAAECAGRIKGLDRQVRVDIQGALDALAKDPDAKVRRAAEQGDRARSQLRLCNVNDGWDDEKREFMGR